MFNVGDKVKFKTKLKTEDGIGIKEVMLNGKIGCMSDDTLKYFPVTVELDGKETYWWVLKSKLELVNEDQRSCTQNVCPRCFKELVSKESFGLFGERFVLKKCESCGWC